MCVFFYCLCLCLPPEVTDAVTSAFSTPLTSCCDPLSSLVNNININVAVQVQHRVSCVDSLKSTFASNASTNKSIGAVSPTLGDASLSGSTQSKATRQSTHPSWSSNHSENLFLKPLVGY